MEGLRAAGVQVDRKMMSEMAVHDEAAFNSLFETAHKAIKNKKGAVLQAA